jgi:arylsulfatase
MRPSSFLDMCHVLLLMTMLLALPACVPRPSGNPQVELPKSPNIVIIMADDMGFSDLGCYGSEINTPNIDKLAERGLVMTRFYNTARCCPSRAALLTGVYQHQAGIGRMTDDRGIDGYRGVLNRRVTTIAEQLKAAGYSTMMTGKWHVGGDYRAWPHRRGFDRYYGVPEGGGVYFTPFFQDNRSIVLDSIVTEPDSLFYSTDAFNDMAVQFIEEQHGSEKPFFLYVAHIAPHFPLQAWPADIARYRGLYSDGFEATREMRFKEMKALGIVPQNTVLSPEDSAVKRWDALSEEEKDMLDLKMATYAAMIERMDMGIGDIVDKLLELRILHHTAIFFLSDNGGSHEMIDRGDLNRIGTRDAFVSLGRSWANVSNTPFRMYKHWVHEGGIATPFIAHYPEMFRGPLRSDYTGHIMDIMPTCLELAGISYPDAYDGHALIPLEGESLVPVFTGKKTVRDNPLFWEHMGNRAVRSGKWKLVSEYKKAEEGPWALYDMEQDMTELRDLSAEYPETVQRLSVMYDQWAEKVGAIPPHELPPAR